MVESERIEKIKRGGAEAYYAAENFNMGRPMGEELVVCPRCYAYLGITRELVPSTTRITAEMRAEAKSRNTTIIASHIYPCPKCRANVLLGPV